MSNPNLFNSVSCEILSTLGIVTRDGVPNLMCEKEDMENESSEREELGEIFSGESTNHISIDGDIKNAFTESVNTCFEGLGWHVIWVKNGNTSYDEIRAAIKQAKVVKDKPTLIKITTTIAFGSSNKVNTYSVYGSALGAKEVDATRKNLGWPYEPFLIPEDVKSHWSRHIPNGAALETEWNAKFSEYEKKFRVNKKGKKESPVAATLCVKHSP
ncbi:hypothetical protein CRG98_045333 [Punica granatum]|uniref:Transketolase N-terminal domain-containing protein n=1 Tax=Punica granatum TaxID=22663 RepID=A0A2I0HRF1_PUNGR|nr:hypothetical protein CRG98_045333 [Punica granatum]